ncbi:hypothetical protein QML41_27985, partial [Klebsiella pneumoniae]
SAQIREILINESAWEEMTCLFALSLGLDYVKRNNKAILNVEVIRKNMDEPREFWTYDCRKVK